MVDIEPMPPLDVDESIDDVSATCVKCGWSCAWRDVHVQYLLGDSLRVWCDRCGYDWDIPTLDAIQDDRKPDPQPEPNPADDDFKSS